MQFSFAPFDILLFVKVCVIALNILATSFQRESAIVQKSVSAHLWDTGIVSMCAFTAYEKFWGHFVTSTSLSLEVPMFSQMSDIQRLGESKWLMKLNKYNLIWLVNPTPVLWKTSNFSTLLK